MILKVQLSVATTEPPQKVLVYNQNRSIHYETDATPEIEKAMGGQLKKFFHAEVEDSHVVLGRPAPWQNW